MKKEMVRSNEENPPVSLQNQDRESSIEREKESALIIFSRHPETKYEESRRRKKGANREPERSPSFGRTSVRMHSL